MEAIVAGAIMTVEITNINIAKDFSPYPHGRTPKDGMHNGETFRDDLLAPAVRTAVQNHGTVVIDLDGVKALGSSFSEEAFGGLLRMAIAPSQDVLRSVEVRYTRPWLRSIAEDIRAYMSEAADR